MKWLNYHHLMYFRVIAIEGGIAKAAKKLRLGQPALSAQLKTLEQAFGHQLFERKNRSLILTDVGKVALRYANEIHEKGQELLEVIDDKSFTSRAHLQLGALDSVPKTLITRMVEHARKTHNCHVTVLEGRGDELLRELMSHQIDLLLSNYPAPTTGASGLFSRSLAKVPVSVFGAPKFLKAKRGFPSSITGEPFVFPTNHSRLRQDLDHYFTMKSALVNVVAEIQDTSVQKILATDGVGLIALPDFSVRSLVKAKSLIKLGTLSGVYEEFWMISANRTIKNPVAREMFKKFKFSF